MFTDLLQKTSLGLQDWKQASVMFAARDRGALIFEAFSNSPPWFMTISGVPRCALHLDSPIFQHGSFALLCDAATGKLCIVPVQHSTTLS